MTNKTPQEIVAAAEQLLEVARFGLEDMRLHPERRKVGFYNAVMSGRAVTFALQNLRGSAEGFDEWYRLKETQMKADPLMRYFGDLRTKIEKQAHNPTQMVVRNLTLSGSFTSTLQTGSFEKFGPRPPGATSFFIGDKNGRSGWEIPLPDGTTEKYFVELPSEIVEIEMQLKDAPHMQGSRPPSATELISACLDCIAEIVLEARRKFVSS